jgi:hypothetical protein
MALTPAQLTTLKAAILADPVLAAKPMNSDGDFDIAVAFNSPASPSFTVWKSNVSIEDTGQAFNGTELAGLTTANNTRLQTIAHYLLNGYNASLPDVRQMFNDIFSGAGGTVTRANLLVVWKRFATRGEKLYATGTGSDAVPATLVFEGSISPQDVNSARNS